MDPFEEFEFKPLTDGLGFQKKTPTLRSLAKEAQIVQRELDKTIPAPPPESFFEPPTNLSAQLKMTDLMKALEPPKDSPQLTPVLARSKRLEARPTGQIEPEKSPIAPGSSHFPEPGPAIRDKSFLPATSDIRRGAADDPRISLIKASTCFQAALLDLIMVTALSLLFLVSLLLITGVALQSIVRNVQVDTTTQVSCVLLFLAVLQMYVVISRSFFGRTLGEWTFDYQLGEDKDHSKLLYPLKVAWRSLLICLTGLITLPILSLIFQTDIAAYLTGLQLYRQKNSGS